MHSVRDLLEPVPGVCGEVSLTHSFLSPKSGSQGLRSLIYEADIQQIN